MAKEIIQISEPMITATKLRKRWLGFSAMEFAECIDIVCNLNNSMTISESDKKRDFPMPYWHIKTEYDEDDNKVISVESCTPEGGDAYNKPYKKTRIGPKRYRYSWHRILFRKSDVLSYEGKYPDVLEGNSDEEESENLDELSLIEVVVPNFCWAGKPASVIVKNMQGDYDECIIAYVLKEWHQLNNLTQIGQLLKSADLSSSGYSKFAQSLLKRAEKYEILQE